MAQRGGYATRGAARGEGGIGGLLNASAAVDTPGSASRDSKRLRDGVTAPEYLPSVACSTCAESVNRDEAAGGLCRRCFVVAAVGASADPHALAEAELAYAQSARANATASRMRRAAQSQANHRLVLKKLSTTELLRRVRRNDEVRGRSKWRSGVTDVVTPHPPAQVNELLRRGVGLHVIATIPGTVRVPPSVLEFELGHERSSVSDSALALLLSTARAVRIGFSCARVLYCWLSIIRPPPTGWSWS